MAVHDVTLRSKTARLVPVLSSPALLTSTGSSRPGKGKGWQAEGRDLASPRPLTQCALDLVSFRGTEFPVSYKYCEG